MTKLKNLSVTRSYSGFLKIDTLTFQFLKSDGTWSPLISREVMERGNAVAVLPYDPATNKVLMIENLLAGAIHANLPNAPLQVIAGMIEEGETPQDVARREAVEEGGVVLDDLIQGPTFMPSPGGTSERIFTFLAKCDLSNAGGQFGVEDENEDIRAHVLDATDVINRLDAGEIEAGPAVILLSWFARKFQ